MTPIFFPFRSNWIISKESQSNAPLYCDQTFVFLIKHITSFQLCIILSHEGFLPKITNVFYLYRFFAVQRAYKNSGLFILISFADLKQCICRRVTFYVLQDSLTKLRSQQKTSKDSPAELDSNHNIKCSCCIKLYSIKGGYLSKLYLC